MSAVEISDSLRIVAKNLAARRNQLGLSVRAVASALGISHVNVVNWEGLKQPISIPTLDKVAEVLGTTSVDLMTPDRFRDNEMAA